MNEVNAERDRVVVVVVVAEEEEESFKANSVKEVYAERDRATPASVDVSAMSTRLEPLSLQEEKFYFKQASGECFLTTMYMHTISMQTYIRIHTRIHTYVRMPGGLKFKMIYKHQIHGSDLATCVW